MVKTLSKFVIFLILGTALLGPAHAKSWIEAAPAEARTDANVIKDESIIIRTDKVFKEVRVANADIADVVVLTDKSFQVMGKASGKTNVMLMTRKNDWSILSMSLLVLIWQA